MNIGGPSPFGLHDDVLTATPDDAGKAALVEELKRRAKAEFASRGFPVAEKLYSKALELQPTDATLWSNRSAARAGLGRHEAALEDAEEAIKAGPDFAKGYFRKGTALTALGRGADAVRAFEEGEKLEPGNASWKPAIAKAKALKATTASPSTPTPAAAKSATTTTAKASSTVAKASGAAAEAEEEREPANGLRGYKTTADGRKTTYFNRDLSEHEKALIGDIAPRKLEGSPTVAGGAEAKAGSAWNTAGTWEERDATAWCIGRITELLADLVVDTPPGPVRIAKVSEVAGDASITYSRGKKRYLYELLVKVEWEARWQCGPAKGTISFPDVSYDCAGAYDATVSVDASTVPAARSLVDEFIKREDNGLRAAINTKLAEFVQEFTQRE